MDISYRVFDVWDSHESAVVVSGVVAVAQGQVVGGQSVEVNESEKKGEKEEENEKKGKEGVS